MLSRTALAVLLIGLVSPGMSQAPRPTALGYQVPDAILYESFFKRVLFLDDAVKKQASPKGWSALPPRDRIQQVVGLTEEQMGTLLAVARDWQAKLNADGEAARQAGQTAPAQAAASGAPASAVPQQLKNAQSKREQLALDGIEQLRTALGPMRFKILDAYVRNTSTLTTPTQILTWYFPLERAAQLMEQRYAIPVTYEQPIMLSHSELGVRRQPNGIEVPYAKEHSLALPPGLSPEETPKLDAALLTKVVEAYHEQNPDQPRYRVLESKLGLHIVPSQIHDETGNLVPAMNLLDARISVPVERRTASEHLKALCDAVTAAIGSSAKPNGGPFDNVFAANGYLLPKIWTGAERPYMLFEWGASGTTAREALIDLLDRSSTTMTWRTSCGPPGQRTGLQCWRNMLVLAVGPERRLVYWDRCKDCRSIPGAQTPIPIRDGKPNMPPGR